MIGRTLKKPYALLRGKVSMRDPPVPVPGELSHRL
jgi:hypothetical protein